MAVTQGAVVAEPGSTLKNRTGSWRLMRPVVDDAKCTGCGICVRDCPEGCMFLENKKARVDYDYCKGCLVCMEECPFKAIASREENK